MKNSRENKLTSWFFKKPNKIDKPLQDQKKKKWRKYELSTTGMKRGTSLQTTQTLKGQSGSILNNFKNEIK